MIKEPAWMIEQGLRDGKYWRDSEGYITDGDNVVYPSDDSKEAKDLDAGPHDMGFSYSGD
jgi:hypothetical protein